MAPFTKGISKFKKIIERSKDFPLTIFFFLIMSFCPRDSVPRKVKRWGTALKFCFGKIIGLAMEVSKKHTLNYSDLLEIEMPLF